MDPFINGANRGYGSQFDWPPSMHDHTAGDEPPVGAAQAFDRSDVRQTSFVYNSPHGTSTAAAQVLDRSDARQTSFDGFHMMHHDDAVAQSDLAGGYYNPGFVSSFDTALLKEAAIDHYYQDHSELPSSGYPSLSAGRVGGSQLHNVTPGWYGLGSFSSAFPQTANQNRSQSHEYYAEPVQGYDALSFGTGSIDSLYAEADHQPPQKNLPGIPPLVLPVQAGPKYLTAHEQLLFPPALGPQHRSVSTKKVKKTYPCLHPKCGKVLSRASDLVRHERTIHNKGAAFHCPEPACKYHEGKGFPRYDKLLSHRRNADGLRKDEQLSLWQYQLEDRRREFSLLPKDERDRRMEIILQTCPWLREEMNDDNTLARYELALEPTT